jgi:CubicO group peptidase (beta-lactamase class C family)
MSAAYEFQPDTKQMKLIEHPHNRYMLTPNYESGGACLAGTADSYMTVVEALANGGEGRNGARILKPETVMMFTHSVVTGEVLSEFRTVRFLEYSYGLGVRVKTTDGLGWSPVGEFGWDGAAGGYAVVDPFNRVGLFYVQHIHNFGEGYNVIHPRVRDLVYKGLAR